MPSRKENCHNSHGMTKVTIGSNAHFVQVHLLNNIYFRRDIHSYLFTMFETNINGLLLPLVQMYCLKFGG